MPRKPQPRKVKIVRYALPDGTRCTKGAPGAVRTVEESETWYASIEGERVSLKTADLSEAHVNLLAELRRRELRRQGITDDMSDHAGRPIAEHQEAWLEAAGADSTGPEQLKLLRAHTTTIFRLCQVVRLADLTGEKVLKALARLRKVDGKSAQTRNHYLRHVKQFTRWCADNDRLAKDPLRALKTVSVQADRRRVHRMPTDAEMTMLFAYLESGEARANKGKSGRGPKQRLADGRLRALTYKVGMVTGFRANELRNLTREGFDLTRGAAKATCRAGYSKRRREDTQPLPDWLAGELFRWFEAGGSWERLPSKGGEMLQADLAAAGVEHTTAAGEFTLHSLRVYYITKLAAQPGIDPKTLFDLSRHSDPKLTLATYAKGNEEARQRAVEGIGQPGTGSVATNVPADAPGTPEKTG